MSDLLCWKAELHDINSYKFPKHHKTDIANLGLSPLFANLYKLVGYAKPAKSTGSQASIVIDPLPRSPKHSMISGYLPKSVLVLHFHCHRTFFIFDVDRLAPLLSSTVQPQANRKFCHGSAGFHDIFWQVQYGTVCNYILIHNIITYTHMNVLYIHIDIHTYRHTYILTLPYTTLH